MNPEGSRNLLLDNIVKSGSAGFSAHTSEWPLNLISFLLAFSTYYVCISSDRCLHTSIGNLFNIFSVGVFMQVRIKLSKRYLKL